VIIPEDVELAGRGMLTNQPGDVSSARHSLLTHHHHTHSYIEMGMAMIGLWRYPGSMNLGGSELPG
jgi:hypothetical protein